MGSVSIASVSYTHLDVYKRQSTYLSYLPEERFSYPLKMNVDDRGSFTEIIRTSDRGQFSVNISKDVYKRQILHLLAIT